VFAQLKEKDKAVDIAPGQYAEIKDLLIKPDNGNKTTFASNSERNTIKTLVKKDDIELNRVGPGAYFARHNYEKILGRFEKQQLKWI
jgi:hypothetical protein